MFLLLAIVIAQLIVKKRWAAVAIVLGVMLVPHVASDAWGWSIPAGLVELALSLVIGLVVFGVALRFGLLAMIAMYWFQDLEDLPLTSDLSLWFAGNAWLVAAVMVAVAGCAAYLAAAGRPLFRDRLLES